MIFKKSEMIRNHKTFVLTLVLMVKFDISTKISFYMGHVSI